MVRTCRLDSSTLDQEQLVGSCEHDIEFFNVP
jgi:hypothetical protein